MLVLRHFVSQVTGLDTNSRTLSIQPRLGIVAPRILLTPLNLEEQVSAAKALLPLRTAHTARMIGHAASLLHSDTPRGSYADANAPPTGSTWRQEALLFHCMLYHLEFIKFSRIRTWPQQFPIYISPPDPCELDSSTHLFRRIPR